MNVLFTIALLAVLGLWAIAVLNRLVRLRSQIKRAWKLVDGGKEGDAAARSRYNELAAKYNEALQAFPGNIIAGLAGFRPAQLLTLNS